jgi:hypothetical protein
MGRSTAAGGRGRPEADRSDSWEGTDDLLHLLRLLRMGPPNAHGAPVRLHLDFEVRGEWIEGQVGTDAAGEGEVVHNRLGFRRELEAVVLDDCRDGIAALVDTEVFEVDDEIVKRGILPIDAVEEPGPLAMILIHVVNVRDCLIGA